MTRNCRFSYCTWEARVLHSDTVPIQLWGRIGHLLLPNDECPTQLGSASFLTGWLCSGVHSLLSEKRQMPYVHGWQCWFFHGALFPPALVLCEHWAMELQKWLDFPEETTPGELQLQPIHAQFMSFFQPQWPVFTAMDIYLGHFIYAFSQQNLAWFIVNVNCYTRLGTPC